MATFLPKKGKHSQSTPRRSTLVPPQILQRHYEAAVAALGEHFPMIDAWLAEHETDLWQQIRQEDDELSRLRQLGVSERRYQAKLDMFLTLCEQAERLYCEARPGELRLPPLTEGERVAIYYKLADGSLQKVKGEEV